MKDRRWAPTQNDASKQATGRVGRRVACGGALIATLISQRPVEADPPDPAAIDPAWTRVCQHAPKKGQDGGRSYRDAPIFAQSADAGSAGRFDPARWPAWQYAIEDDGRGFAIQQFGGGITCMIRCDNGRFTSWTMQERVNLVEKQSDLTGSGHINHWEHQDLSASRFERIIADDPEGQGRPTVRKRYIDPTNLDLFIEYVVIQEQLRPTDAGVTWVEVNRWTARDVSP